MLSMKTRKCLHMNALPSYYLCNGLGIKHQVTNPLRVSCSSTRCSNLMTDGHCYVDQICRKCEEVEGATSAAGVDHESVKTAGISIFPCDKNILVSFATTSGRAAYRAATSGSPYIQKLTQVQLHMF